MIVNSLSRLISNALSLRLHIVSRKPVNHSLIFSTCCQYSRSAGHFCQQVNGSGASYIFSQVYYLQFFSQFAHLWCFEGRGFGVGVLEGVLLGKESLDKYRRINLGKNFARGK